MEMTAGQNLEEKRRLARRSLEWLIEMGADELIGERPLNLLAPKELIPPAPAHSKQPETPSTPRTKLPRAISFEGPVGDAAGLAAACAELDEVREALLHFDTCPLQRTATNLVYYDGNPRARVLFIGEAPGREEDEQGRP